MSLWANVDPAPALPRDPVDAVVIGAGSAGYTAGLYLARGGHRPLLFSGSEPGGQLSLGGTVENFPGWPDGIDGAELMVRMREQAERAGTQVYDNEVTAIEFAPDPAKGESELLAEWESASPAEAVHTVHTTAGTVHARTIIVATGSIPKKLGVPGEAELGGGLGVAYCAACEAPLFAGKRVVVVGGGDSAMEDALALSVHASQVTLVHRSAQFRATHILQQRVSESDNIDVLTDTEVRAVHADPQTQHVGAIELLTRGGNSQMLEAEAIFVAIGHTPQTALVADTLELSAIGTVQTSLPGGATAIPGVYVAGDLADDRFRQAVTAAGSGCAAALEASRYLRQKFSRESAVHASAMKGQA